MTTAVQLYSQLIFQHVHCAGKLCINALNIFMYSFYCVTLIAVRFSGFALEMAQQFFWLVCV